MHVNPLYDQQPVSVNLRNFEKFFKTRGKAVFYGSN